MRVKMTIKNSKYCYDEEETKKLTLRNFQISTLISAMPDTKCCRCLTIAVFKFQGKWIAN